MAICLTAAGMALHLAASHFTLSWLHSVEKTPWQESWIAGPDGLRPVEARIKGSGAGMDPPEGAKLQDGWYVYYPQVPLLSELVLAASGETASGWTFCAADECHQLGAAAASPIRIRWCE